MADSIIKANLLHDSLQLITSDYVTGINIRKDSANFKYLQLYSSLNLGDLYEKNNKLDSALLFSTLAQHLATESQDIFMLGAALNNLGNVYAKSSKNKEAFESYRSALAYLNISKNEDFICETTLGLATLFEENKQPDSARYFATRSFYLSKADGFQERMLNASSFLAAFYENIKQTDSSFKYLQVMVTVKDSINSRERIKQVQITFNERAIEAKRFKGPLAKREQAKCPKTSVIKDWNIYSNTFFNNYFVEPEKN